MLLNNDEEMMIKPNSIVINIEVSKEDINEDIYFICDKKNYLYYTYDEFSKNTSCLTINGQSYPYKKSHKFYVHGNFLIKISLSQNIYTLRDIFYYCKNIVSVDLSNFNTKNLNSIAYMFARCSNLRTVNFGNDFNTQKVTNMSALFYGCTNLKQIFGLENFITKNVTDLNQMFDGCENLLNINLRSFMTKNVLNTSFMFRECARLSTIDLGSFDFKKVKTIYGMFYHCSSVCSINILSDLNLDIYFEDVMRGLGDSGVFVCRKSKKFDLIRKDLTRRWKFIKV